MAARVAGAANAAADAVEKADPAAYAAAYATIYAARAAHADGAFYTNEAAVYAAGAALDTADAAARVAGADAADTPSVATGETTYSVNAVWRALSKDATALERGLSTYRLLELPLWRWATPPEWASNLWSRLKAGLPKDEGWEVWTDWYDARLEGRLLNLDLERARATEVMEIEWDAGPRVSNARIKQIIARFGPGGDLVRDPETRETPRSVLPPQTDRAPRFADAPDGRIAPAAPSVVAGPADVLRADVARKARAICKTVDPVFQDDRREVRRACGRIADLLSASAIETQASAASIWSDTRTLRAKRDADLRRQKLSEEERERQGEGPPLLAGVSEDLGDLLDTISALARADPDLGTLFGLVPSVEETETASAMLAQGARKLAANAAQADDLVTPRAAEILAPAAGRASSPPEAVADAIDAGTVGNLIVKAIEKAAPEALQQIESGEIAIRDRAAAQLVKDVVQAGIERLEEAIDKAAGKASGKPASQSFKEGAFVALGAGAVTAAAGAGRAALDWVLANGAEIIAVASANPALQMAAAVVDALLKLFL